MQSRAFAKALSQGGSLIWPPVQSSSIIGNYPSLTALLTTIQPSNWVLDIDARFNAFVI
ncbi:hypothetical protein [Phyllobacterium zundukense]|uniref:Uncharacterized protein n=1 Tax=Phyllobacterium zundukense TaxID=1867719 RepID=A0ACD4CYK5_9HYPH|nr:hypothetical protein [Phyllobacterium zundukense]UXN58533.1 hypothetical protein N8E88_10965 [Phyllobacterium zundukense]